MPLLSLPPYPVMVTNCCPQVHAIIKPVYKKGDKLLTTNYRPISLLTPFSKIFKKLIYFRLYKHVRTNNILFIQEQSGFGINSSMEAAIYNVISEILKATNNRFSVGRIFCDLKKAFNCVNLGILVDKLHFYGISGKFITLIHSYLRERYQKLLINKINAYNGACSRWKKVTNGVPLGLILGQLLFHTYINDLPKITDNDAKVVLFVDDTRHYSN